MKRQISALLLHADYRADGIRLRLLGAAAVLQVFLAPLWDRYLQSGRVAANLEPATFLATILFLSLLLILTGGRLLALSCDGDTDIAVGVSLRRALGAAGRALRAGWQILRAEPLAELGARLGAALCVILLALRGAIGTWGRT